MQCWPHLNTPSIYKTASAEGLLSNTEETMVLAARGSRTPAGWDVNTVHTAGLGCLRKCCIYSGSR
jgi:hypothetical protein